MAKKSASGQEHSQNKGGGHNLDKGERPGKAAGHGQKTNQRKMAKGIGSSAADSGNLFEGQRKIGGAKSKSGCLPKLFTLLLPLIALGTYAFLRS